MTRRRKEKGEMCWKEFNRLIESVPMDRFERALKEYFERRETAKA